MKPFHSSRPSWLNISASALLTFLSIGLAGPAGAATTYYWDTNGAVSGSGTTTTGTWGGESASAFWGTSDVGTSETTAAAITSDDTVVFSANDGAGNANNLNGGYTVTLGDAQSVYGLVIAAGPTLGANGAGGSPTIAGIGMGLSIGAGGMTLNGSSGDPTFSSLLGTITLTADQTWTINNLHVYAVAAAVAGNATAGNTRTWTLGYVQAYTPTISGFISDGFEGGKLALTVNNSNGVTTGGGVYNITGTNNIYTGKTTVAQGVLQFNSIADVGQASSLGAPTTVADGTIDLGSGATGATLRYNGSFASTSDRVINLAGTTGGGTIENNAATANTLTLTGGITNAGGGSKVLTLGGSNTGTNTISGVISDAADFSTTSLVKTGNGTWTLSGNNTFTGSVTVSAGTLNLNGSNTFFTLTLMAGTVNLNAASAFDGGVFINGGTLSVNAAGALGVNSDTNSIFINGGNLLIGPAGTVGSNQLISIGINGGGIGVSADPTDFAGAGDIAPGVTPVFGLNYTGTGGIGTVANITTLFASGWSLGAFTTGTYTGTVLYADPASNYRLGGGGGTLTIQNTNNNILTGANNLVIGATTGGTIILNGTNDYTGGTSVNNGTLSISSMAALGSSTEAVHLGSVNRNVGLDYRGAGESTSRGLDLSGTGGTVTLSNSGTGDINYLTEPTYSGFGAKTLILGAATDSWGGSIGGLNDTGGVLSVTKRGLSNSTWILNGVNAYTGTTTINGGVLQLDPATIANSYLNLQGADGTHLAVLQTSGTLSRALSGVASAANLNWAPNSGFAAKGADLVLDINGGGDLVWGAGNFMGAGAAPIVFGSTTADHKVVLANNINLNTADAFNRVFYVEKGLGGDSAELTGILSPGTSIGSATGLTKQGAGILVLSGANTYNGTTLVNAGTLVVNGTHTNAGAYTVSSGATLGGKGQINTSGVNLVTVNNGGFLAPGDPTAATPTGVLSIGNPIQLNSGSTLVLQLGGATPGAYDQLNMTNNLGMVTLQANVNLSLSLVGGFNPQSTDIFYILNREDISFYLNFFAGAGEGATVDLGGGYTGQITYLANWAGTQEDSSLFGGNDVAIYNVAAIPEPATLALIGLGGLFVTVFARRHARARVEV